MIRKTVLDCGLAVISEERADLSTFALSYTLRGGSRAEERENSGIHHLIEHMMFKGSEKYDLKQIAEVSDRLGGTLNALTGKELTQFYIKAIDEKLTESFDLLTDIVLHATFPAVEFDREKNVVIQEIRETEDNPDSYAFDLFYEEVFENNGMGYPIAGQAEVVAAFGRDRVFDFYSQAYRPENLILTAVGNVRHERLVELAAKYFSGRPPKRSADFSFTKPAFRFTAGGKKNPSLQQVYALMGFRGLAFDSPLKYKYKVMNNILGAGMSSRLFQEIREEKGLAYTISSFSDYFLEDGIHIVYAIVEPDKTGEYLQAVGEEIGRLKADGIGPDELAWAKDYLKSSLILNLESNVNRMRFHVNQELYLQGEMTPERIIDDIHRTTREDIDRLIRDHLDFNRMALFLYGNISPEDYTGFKFE